MRLRTSAANGVVKLSNLFDLGCRQAWAMKVIAIDQQNGGTSKQTSKRKQGEFAPERYKCSWVNTLLWKYRALHLISNPRSGTNINNLNNWTGPDIVPKNLPELIRIGVKIIMRNNLSIWFVSWFTWVELRNKQTKRRAERFRFYTMNFWRSVVDEAISNEKEKQQQRRTQLMASHFNGEKVMRTEVTSVFSTVY